MRFHRRKILGKDDKYNAIPLHPVCRMKATADFFFSFFRRALYRLKADKKYEPVPTINLQKNVFNDCGGESCQKRGIFLTTDQTD